MTPPHKPLIFFLATLSFALPAQAQWTGQGELGLVLARGNAKTETGNFKLNFTVNHGQWRHLWNNRVLYGRNNDLTAADRWETFLQSERKLDDKPFVFASARYEEDRFGGFAYQETFSSGLGYDFIDTPRTKFSVSAGAGYRKLLPQQIVRDDDGNFLERIDGTMAEDVVGKAGVRYQRQLTQSTTLTDNLLVESGSQNTLAQNDITVQVAMTARLALGLGHSVRHNAQPPEGQIETDQLTTVNLVYTLQ